MVESNLSWHAHQLWLVVRTLYLNGCMESAGFNCKRTQVQTLVKAEYLSPVNMLNVHEFSYIQLQVLTLQMVFYNLIYKKNALSVRTKNK